MKRIIFTVSNDLNHDQRMQRICGTLARNGYDVTLVGRKHKHSMPVTERTYHQHRLSIAADKGKIFYILLNIRLLWFLLKVPVDVICVIDLDTILAGKWAARIRKKKLVYDAHEFFTEVPEVVRRPRIQRVWKWIERASIPKVDAMYTVSAGLAELYFQRYGITATVIRNLPVSKECKPVNAMPIPGGLEMKENYLLYQGALNEGRGLESLIAIMDKIPEKLVMAGEGELSEELRELVHKRGLQEKIIFLGMLRPEALWEWTCNAWIGVNLLENKGLSYYHSLSNKFLDYIQAGVPSICIDFPEYSHINKKWQVAELVGDCASQNLLMAIEMMRDSKHYNMLANNCRQAATELNWEKESEKLLSVYNDLTSDE